MSDAMHPEPTDEHRRLLALAGTWSHESTCDMGDGSGPQVTRGTEVVRAFGDFWILCDGTFDPPGVGPMKTLMTLGFDPRTGRHVGTWVGSSGPTMFVYDGALADDGRTLALDTRGPDFLGDPAQTARYRDEMELATPDRRVLRSYRIADDGSRTQMVESVFERTG